MNLTDSTQTSLLRRVGDAGDHAAWSEFDRRYGPLVLRYCLRRGLQLSDAEDIRQVVMLSLTTAMARFEYRPARGRFRDYLGRVVVNAIARQARRAGTPTRQLDPDAHRAIAAVGCTPLDEHWSREWMTAHCRAAADHVRAVESAEHIRAFDRLLAGHSAAAISAELGLTPEAVRKLHQRLRERLRAFIAARIAEEEAPYA